LQVPVVRKVTIPAEIEQTLVVVPSIER